MDVENGEILCSVSSPGYDPNIFSDDLDVNFWNNLKNNSRAPLLNRSMSGVYPPGSTIKMSSYRVRCFKNKRPSDRQVIDVVPRPGTPISMLRRATRKTQIEILGVF